MRQPGWIKLLLTALALLGAAPLASAATAPAKEGVSFVSGGVGEEALAALKAREKEFNLKLVFTLTEGNYLADVGVRVADASGRTVIEHVADGPVFMARVPPGTYTVTASYNGNTQTRKVTVGERLQTAYLRWPAQPGRDLTLPLKPGDLGAARVAATDGGPGGDGSPASAPAPGAGVATSTAPTGVKFIAGGVGESAEERMKAAQDKFNLKLVFTLVEGNYLADVNVAIKDRSGKTLLQELVPGPFLLAELPPGSYEITATYDGKPRSRTVRVGKGLSTEYFRWPSDPKTDFTLKPDARK